MALEKVDTSGGFAPRIPLDEKIIGQERQALRLDGSLDENNLSPVLHQTLLSIARVRNAVSSLKLEGVAIELEDARNVVESGVPKTDGELMALRISKKLTWINDTPREDLPSLSIELIKKIHRDIFEGVFDVVGKLKTEPNYIVSAVTGQPIFFPTPPERTESELNELFKWYSTIEKVSPSAISVAGILFAELEAIHPFNDGNGRVGRIIVPLVLKRLGFENIALVPLDGKIFRTQEKYYETLATTNNGITWHTWCGYLARQINRAFKTAANRSSIGPLVNEISSPIGQDLLMWILAGPGEWYPPRDYPNPKGASRNTLSNMHNLLLKKGVLESKGEKKGRKYRLATEYLKKLY